MGNCINLSLCRSEKAKVHIFDDGENEFRSSKLINEAISGSHNGNEFRSSKPKPGKAGYFLPQDGSVYLKIIKNESCHGRSIKIVLTKKQLELLLRDAKMFQSMKTGIRSPGRCKRAHQKWQPSLSAIPEVQDH